MDRSFLGEFVGGTAAATGVAMLRNRAHQPRGGRTTDLIVADFGRAVLRKLHTREGSPEDHIRAPFEDLLAAMADQSGLAITMIGETRLPDLSVRPDYAVDVAGARVGYIELKKPGHGVPGTWSRPSKHDREQWEKLKLLPNVLYSDGQTFAHFSFGELRGEVARLAPELGRAGEKLRPVDGGFDRVMRDFLLWEPVKPRSLKDLVGVVSKLCLLLRDDVAAELLREQNGQRSGSRFTSLAEDWRQVLFPNLTPAQFADQYAQTISFALLLARVEGVSFLDRSVGEIARLLGKKHSLMGRALAILTDQFAEEEERDGFDDDAEEHSVALTTMLRVLSVVDWTDFPDDSYNMLYEDFLTAYDPALRRKSGVYYTPAALVGFLTRFTDDVLRHRLGKRHGFAEPDVIVVDPAMGTGSFLAEVIDVVAATIGREQGPGAVAPYLRGLSDRLIGFENQAAPYAVAELRIHSLLRKRHQAEVPRRQRRFLADTLDDPDAQSLPIYYTHKVLANSRQGANKVKREPVMVVIGNPPYADKAKGTAPWVELPSASPTIPSLSAFRLAGNGRLEYVLSNKYVYFWRWATWKVFDAHPEHPAGVVAFVCPAGFLAGPGFAGMREYLRRTADEGWIIDLTPEGHQPPVNTRFFQGNQQPICVAVFIRRGRPAPCIVARVHRTSVSGTIAQKAVDLDRLLLDGPDWQECQTGWSSPFQFDVSGAWAAMPTVTDLLPWAVPGVKPNRTWVYAPEVETLRERWLVLVRASAEDKSMLMKETRDSSAAVNKAPLPRTLQHSGPILVENGGCPQPQQMNHRPFDRKWLVPDARLLDTPRPPLWLTASVKQIFVVEQHAHPISSGPALLFSSLIPDMHAFMGHHGGRVVPLFRDETGTVPNIASRLLGLLGNRFGCVVQPEDLIAYLAAVTAHPGFTRRFAMELTRPGIRIPLTGDGAAWRDAVAIGREVVWLHTFGERCVEPAADRPAETPRMTTGAPKVTKQIPHTAAGMPTTMDYDAPTRTLRVGAGEIAPVAPEVVAYEVSGTVVLRHWFGYRRKVPAGNKSSPLNDIVATTWTAAMTTELLAVLNVLGRCVALEPRQDALLERIVAGPLITVDDLTAAAVLPIPAAARKPPKPSTDHLFSLP